MKFIKMIFQDCFILNWFNSATLSSMDIFSASKLLSLYLKLIRAARLFFYNLKTKAIVIPTVILAIFSFALRFPVLGFWVITFIASFYTSYKKPIYAFMLLILSCEISSRVNLGVISSNTISLKIDDVMILSLLLATLWRYAQGRIKLKPVATQLPFMLFICIGTVSLLRGMFIHTIDKPIVSLFVMFKWIEYLTIFYLAYLYLDSRNSIKFILITVILSGLLVSLYGYWEYINPKGLILYFNYYRLFDRGIFLGQNNLVAGFFVIWFCLIWGLFSFTKNIKYKLLLGLSGLIGTLPFIATYSRKSYIALAFAIIILILLTGKKSYLITFLIVLFLISLFFGTRITERFTDIKDFFFLQDTYRSQRYYFLRNWQISLRTLENYPFIGAGFGSRHRLFYESQWAMIAAESGILGLLAFCYTLLLILKSSFLNYKVAKDWLVKGFALGFIAVLFGIFVHSLSCVSMVVARIGVPFWLLSGMMSHERDAV